MIPYSIMSMKLLIKDGTSREVRILDLSVDRLTFRLAKEIEAHEDIESLDGVNSIKGAADIKDSADIKGTADVKGTNDIKTIEEIHIHYYHPIPHLTSKRSTRNSQNCRWEQIRLEQFTLEKADTETEDYNSPFYQVYRITSDQENFHQANQRLMEAYMGYIRGKWEMEGSELARELTGYPAEQEEIYSENWVKQRKQWYREAIHHTSPSSCKCSLPVGLILGERNAWEKLISSEREDFLTWYWTDQGLEVKYSPRITHLYLGNSYCHHLLPTLAEWKELMKAAVRIGCQPVILLPPLRESAMEAILEDRIRPLALWWKDNRSRMRKLYGDTGSDNLEIVVNDWGMLEACGRIPDVSITLGVHLNKYRKDVRLPWRHLDAKEYQLLQESAGLPKEYLSWLQENHRVTGLSWEVCGYVPKLPGTVVDDDGTARKEDTPELDKAGVTSGEIHEALVEKGTALEVNGSTLTHTLYLPMMSMNTGGHCTLRAACETGNRGHQRYSEGCPGYCREHAFLYPDFLGMVGRYNTLWGYDPAILMSEEYLQEWTCQGVSRIVWNGV